MGFLPSGYTTPKSNSNYMKLEEGKNRFRVVSPAIVGYEYWTNDNKPVRLKSDPKSKPADVRINDDGSYTVKHFWAFAVIDRNDLGGVIKILELTQAGIMRDMESLFSDSDWGDPIGYDITVTRTGQKLETKYSTMPNPAKPLTEEEKELIESNPVNLNALFSGGDPFSEKVADMPEDEIKLKDIPF